MKGIRTDHRAIGVAGVVGVILMGLLVLAISIVPFGKRGYTAMFEHTAGLRVGEEVQIAGVGVGKVRDIALDGHHVKVGFTVTRSVRLGGKSTAAIRVATLLGTHFLEVKPAGSGGLAHDTIPLTHTTVPYNLQDVIEGSTHALDQLDGAKIATSMQVMADTLRGTPQEARRAINGVSRLSDVAARRSDQLRELLASTRSVTGVAAANSDKILDLMKQSDLVLHELTSRRQMIDQMLIDSHKLATEISGVLKDNQAAFEPLMRNFTVTLKTLKSERKNLTSSIDGLSTMVTYFSNATGNGPWMDLHVPDALGDNFTCGAPNSGCQ